MGRSDQLNTAFCDRPCCLCFQFPADLVDDDHFRVMGFDRFDHHFMLQGRLSDLQTACVTDGRMRHVAVSADLIGCVYDDHTFLFGKDPCGFPKHRCLADPRFSQDEQAFSGVDMVCDDVKRPEDRPSDAAGQTDDAVPPIADRGDPVKCPFHACAVVKVKGTDFRNHRIDIFIGNFISRKGQIPVGISRQRDPSHIHHNFCQFFQAAVFIDHIRNFFRQNVDQRLYVIKIIQILFHKYLLPIRALFFKTSEGRVFS